jgi:hypothetical protein
MDTFRATAFGLSIWYAFLATLAAVLLVSLNDVDASTACLAGATVALIFALVLIAKVRSLSEGAALQALWRALPAHARPRGEAGQRMARKTMAETWLRFARGAAVIAMVFCGLAYATHGPGSFALAEHFNSQNDD